MGPSIRIEAADPLGPVAMSLLGQAALEVRRLYPDLFGPDAPMPTNEPLAARAAYLVAFVEGRPVGCGALRPLDERAAEVRRMYVQPPARRLGVARAILARLEHVAAGLGYGVLRLETGNRQQPAMALYESCGFRRIAPFGAYVNDPASVCYEKPVAPSPLVARPTSP